MSGQVDVLRFMTLRAGEGGSAGARLDLVFDDEYVPGEGIPGAGTHEPQEQVEHLPTGLHDADLFSAQSLSPIGRLVYAALYGSGVAGLSLSTSQAEDLKRRIIDSVESSLVAGLTYGVGSQSVTLPPVIRTVDLGSGATPANARAFASLGRRAHYFKGSALHILPAEIDDFAAPVSPALGQAVELMRNAVAARGASSANALEVLTSGVAKAVGTSEPLMHWVFTAGGRYSPEFALSKRILLDHLYALYVLRKRERVPLEPITAALVGLNAIELLALGQYFRMAMLAGALPQSRAKVVDVLATRHPVLVDWNPAARDANAVLTRGGVPRIETLEDLARCLQAKPVVHPVFARLTAALRPFNSLQPVGIGDLKVVKQTFLGYRKGEISHVETVLAGETKKHQHRSLDRVEDSFTALSSSDSEVVRDSQSTTRFELKNEVEEALKTDLGVNAGASFTYKSNPVVDASVTAGMTFASSRSISEKASRSFVNEVMAKATSRVQARVSQSRTQNRLSETEETVSHEFTNTAGNHISGIYRWLDKVYQGQVHNYGKRLMFEFVLPEPAAFFVESRLYAYLMSLDLPVHPGGGGTSVVRKMPVATPSEINEATYLELARDFDLDELGYPRETIDNPALSIFSNDAGETSFKIGEKYVIGRAGIKTQVYNGHIQDLPAGYYIDRVFVSGSAQFANKNEPAVHADVQNTLVVSFGQKQVFRMEDETSVDWSDFSRGVYEAIAPGELVLSSPFSINITDHTCIAHDLRFSVTLKRSSTLYGQWQQQVFDAVYRQVHGSSSNETDPQAARIAEYEQKLEAIKGLPLNEIIQGKSSTANEAIVKRELKRQCLAVVAKEFDSVKSDDVAGNLDATAPRLIDVLYPSLEVGTPPLGTGDPEVRRRAVARFVDRPDEPLPAFTTIHLERAQKKGAYVQFLEQAFEWEQMSSLFYPYFWAKLPRWVELMNREDPADPLFTEFLQAGSARVLLAVKPGYENAVLHFLATREPWEGGPSPVVGDPLFIPLYQEVHNRQDDLAGSVPEGEPWVFSLPTSLIYLESEQYPLTMEYTS